MIGRVVNHRFEFATTVRYHREAMLAAAGSLMTGRTRLLWALNGVFLTILTAAGGLSVATFLASWANRDPAPWMIVGWFVGGLFFLINQQIIYRALARRAMSRPMNRGQQIITLDDAGLTLATDELNWHTPWAMVDKVAMTKNTLALSVAGIAFAIPKDRIGDADATAALRDEIENRLSHA